MYNIYNIDFNDSPFCEWGDDGPESEDELEGDKQDEAGQVKEETEKQRSNLRMQ